MNFGRSAAPERPSGHFPKGLEADVGMEPPVSGRESSARETSHYGCRPRVPVAARCTRGFSGYGIGFSQRFANCGSPTAISRGSILRAALSFSRSRGAFPLRWGQRAGSHRLWAHACDVLPEDDEHHHRQAEHGGRMDLIVFVPRHRRPRLEHPVCPRQVVDLFGRGRIAER